MSSAGTLVNFNGLAPLTMHHHPHHHHHIGLEGGGGLIGGGVHPQQLQQSGAQLNMLDVKMSTSPSSSSSPCSSSAPSLSPVTPVNIMQECYIGMWDSEMSAPPPTKLETTDIMDLIEPSGMTGGGGRATSSPMSPSPATTSVQVDPGNTSPTTIIHHTPSAPTLSLASVVASSNSHYSSSPHSSISPTSTSSSSSTSSTASSQYLVPLPSLGDPYGSSADGTTCHLLDGFHSAMDTPFHKMPDPSQAFQEGGYDAFISDISQPPPPNISHQEHHPQSHHHAPPPHHHHHQNQHVHSLHDNGVLLLDMSSAPPPPTSLHHHPPNNHHQLHDGSGQCSPGCPCLSNSAYSPNSLGSGGGDPFGGGGVNSQHHLHLHHHHPHEIHRHHSDYSSSWDDLHGGQHTTADLAGDYSILFRKESPSTSDSVVSYPDNDSESKSSSVGLSDISRHHPHISPPPAKRKVGRPPKKDKKLKRNEKKTGRLWEFIRDLLKNPEYCPSLVKWENHEEGHFRFVNSEKVAQLWGKIKGNPRMTYEKLSRAMRYYYKSHVFEPVLGRRLVYKFGYNATNWKPINPNFVSSGSSAPSHPNPHHHLHVPHHTHPHQYQHHHKLYN